MTRMAKFNIGEYVIHKRQGYRAMVVDIDPLFQASGRYNPQAVKRTFAQRKPWYRLLVDESSQITYVEENCLVFDNSNQDINNPNIAEYVIKQGDRYFPRKSKH